MIKRSPRDLRHPGDQELPVASTSLDRRFGRLGRFGAGLLHLTKWSCIIMVSLWLLLQGASFILLRQQWLINEVDNFIRRDLGTPYDLEVDFSNLRAGPGIGLQVSGVEIRDLRQNAALIASSDRVYIRLSVTNFLLSLGRFEAAVSEIWLDQPEFRLAKDEAGKWIWERFTKPAGGALRPIVRLKKARLVMDTPLFANPLGEVAITDALIDYRSYPRLRGSLACRTDLDPSLRVAAGGEYDFAGGRGRINVDWSGASLPVWQKAGWLPAERVLFLRGVLQGEIQADVGPEPALRQGRINLADGLVQVDQPGLPPVAIQGEAVLRNRFLDLANLQIQIDDAVFLADARLNLRAASSPGLDGEIEIANLDLGLIDDLIALPEGMNLNGRVRGRVQLGGNLRRPELGGSISLTGGELVYPLLPALRDIKVRGRFEGNELVLQDLAAETSGGRVTGEGRLTLTPRPELNLDFTSDALAIDAIAAGLGHPGWGGKVDAKGRVAATAGWWKADVDLTWAGLSWQDRQLPGGRSKISATGDDSAQKFRAEGRIGRGAFTADGQGGKNGWEASAQIDRLTIAPFSAFLPPAYADLDGLATLALSLRERNGLPELSVAGRVNDARLAGYDFDDCQGSVRWRGTEIIVDTAQLRAGDATATMSGRYDQRRKDMDLTINLHRVPVGDYLPETGGYIEAQVKMAGQWPRLTGKAWANLSRLSWRGIPLGLAEIGLDARDGKVTVDRFYLESAAGRAEVEGGLDLARRELDLKMSEFHWSASSLSQVLPGQADLKGEITADGRLQGTFTAPIGSFQVKTAAGEAYGFAWDNLTAALNWDGALSIEKGQIAAAAPILLRGALSSAGWDLTVQSERADLGKVLAGLPFEPPSYLAGLTGTADFTAQITGPLSQPAVAGELTVLDADLGGFACKRMTARFALQDGILRLPALAAGNDDDLYYATGAIDLVRREIDLQLRISQGDLAEMLELAKVKTKWPVGGDVTGEAELSGTLDAPIFAVSMRLEDGTLDDLSLTGEVEFTYIEGTLSLDSLRLTDGIGTLEGSGRLAAGDFRVEAAGVGMPLNHLGRLAGFGDIMDGRADFRLTLDRYDRAMGGEFKVTLGPGASWAKIPLNRGVLTGSIRDRNLALSQVELVSGGQTLTITGRLPLPNDLGPLEVLLQDIPRVQDRISLRIEGKNLPLSLFSPGFAESVSFTGGTIDITAGVGGTWAVPALTGRISVADGQGTTTFLPEPFRELRMNLDLEGQSMVVSSADVRLGGGTAELKGRIDVINGRPRYDLRFAARNVLYRNNFLDGKASWVDLTVSGQSPPVISGTIRADETRITVSSGAGGSPPPLAGLNVQIVAGDNVRFFLPGLADVPVTGEVVLGGTTAAPTMSGVATAARGTIIVYNERFSVETGLATFTPDRGCLPFIEIEGMKVIRGYKVYINARGETSAPGLTITMWSDPPLSQQEILDLLNIMKPPGADDGSPEAATGLFYSGFELVMNTIFGQISEDFRRLIDADDLHLTMDENTGTLSLEMGKFVSRDLYLSYHVDFNEFSTRIWSFDYYVVPYLVLSGKFSSLDSPELSLTYQFSF